MDWIYLDNAASSLPKAPGVAEAVFHYLTEIGANPGRSGHRLSVAAARIIFEARERVAELLGASDSRRVVFTSGATASLNLVLKGLLRPGDQVVTTTMEHNSVSRPLRWLQENRRLEVTVVPADQAGRVDPSDFGRVLTDRTALVVVNHASNVCGALAPIDPIRREIGKVPLLVDAAQTAGAVPIQVEQQEIDFLAFTGHKGLLGPPGTGGLYVRPGLEPEPLLQGGTGSSSSCDLQPEMLPDRYESGTSNAAGIAGLGAGVGWILEQGVEEIRRREMELFRHLWTGLSGIPGIRLYGPEEPEERVATFSFNLAGIPPSEVGLRLDREHGILVRVGLHCAPWAHRCLGSLPGGTVRLSPGCLGTRDEMERVVQAVASIARDGAS